MVAQKSGEVDKLSNSQSSTRRTAIKQIATAGAIVGGLPATVRAATPVIINSPTKITESGQYVIGSNFDTNSQYGVEIVTSDVNLDGSGYKITGDGNSDGILIRRPENIPPLENINVSDLVVQNCVHGIHFPGVERNRTNGTLNAVVNQCDVSQCVAGIRASETGFVDISNNSVTECTYVGISVFESDSLLSNNKSVNNGRGIDIDETNKSEVTRNNVNSNQLSGLYFSLSGGVEVTGNTFLNNGEYGVFTDFSAGIIAENIFCGNEKGPFGGPLGDDAYGFNKRDNVFCEIVVDMEVKPDSINPARRGVISVRILHTEDFDPTLQVDVDSLLFGPPDIIEAGGGASPIHEGHIGDVNDDGDDDLLVHFPIENSMFDSNDSQAKIVGETNDGTPITGTTSILVRGRPNSN